MRNGEIESSFVMPNFPSHESTCVCAVTRPTRIAQIVIFIQIMISIAVSNIAGAQIANFNGVQSTIPTGMLNYAYGVTVDSSGNLYIANSGLGTVLKETPSSSGGFIESTLGSGLFFPAAVAVDASGNIYIADTDNDRAVKETLSGDNYSQTVIASGLHTPYGIAVDGSGNVFIADTGGNRVLKETPSGGSYTESQIIAGSFRSVAVDANANLYLTDTNNVYKETLSGGTYSQNLVASGIGGAFGVAVDSKGVVFIADTDTASAGRVLEEIPTPSGYTQVVIYSGTIGPVGIAVDWQDNLYVTNIYTNQVQKFATAGANFGFQAIGVPSSGIPLTFTFSSGGSIGVPAVLTQGASGLDFADAGTGTCTTNGIAHTYNVGDSCTVIVKFTPKYPGTRYGGVNILNSSNDVIATGYLIGTGIGPQVSFLPGTQSSIASATVVNPLGIAIDASGNLFIADFSHNRVLKESPSGASYTESIVVSTSPNAPSRIAVDGSGNVFVYDGTQILKETPSVNGYKSSSILANNHLNGMTVDGYGNIYVSDDWFSIVRKETPTPAGYVETTVPSTGLLDPFAVAVDGDGNVYIADPNNLRIVKETFSAGKYTQSIIPSTGLTDNAQWIAVDAINNLYISDFGSKLILKETLSSSGYTQSTVPATGLNSPAGIAIEQTGNIFIADTNNNQILKENFAGVGPLTFASTAYGVASPDSPKSITVQNSGNDTLTFPIPATGTNPSIGLGFVLSDGVSSACPVLGSQSSVPGTLAPASSCDLSVSFVPAALGSISGAIVLRDNALNAAAPGYTTQSIALSGTATKATPANQLSSSANSAFSSTSVTFTAALSSQGGSPTGTVTFYDGATQLGTVSLNAGRASYATSSLLAGAHSITAAYSGDSNFTSVTSAVMTENIVSLSIGGSTSATSSPRATATYSLTFTPSSGMTTPAAIQLGVVGLPAGATSSFNPNPIPAGTGATTVTLSISLPATANAKLPGKPFDYGRLPFALACVVLPFARRYRKLGLFCFAAMLSLGSVVLLAGLTGCGNGGASSSTSPRSYTLTATATSGSYSQNVPLTLTVQ